MRKTVGRLPKRGSHDDSRTHSDSHIPLFSVPVILHPSPSLLAHGKKPVPGAWDSLTVSSSRRSGNSLDTLVSFFAPSRCQSAALSSVVLLVSFAPNNIKPPPLLLICIRKGSTRRCTRFPSYLRVIPYPAYARTRDEQQQEKRPAPARKKRAQTRLLFPA